MAGHIPDPFHPRDGIHPAQEGGKGILLSPVLPIRIHILSQEGEFTVAQFHRLPDLFTDGLGAAAPFPSPDIGHDTVGAEVVAAIHDGHPGRIAALPYEMALKFPGHDGQVVVHAGLSLGLVQISLEDGAEIVHMSRTNEQVHLGILLQEVFPVFLGHAAGDTEDFGRIFPLDLLHLPDFAQDLLFRAFPDAAGIDQDHVCMVIVFGIMVAQVGQLPGIMF